MALGTGRAMHYALNALLRARVRHGAATGRVWRSRELVRAWRKGLRWLAASAVCSAQAVLCRRCVGARLRADLQIAGREARPTQTAVAPPGSPALVRHVNRGGRGEHVR